MESRSLPRDWPGSAALGALSLSHGTTREVLGGDSDAHLGLRTRVFEYTLPHITCFPGGASGKKNLPANVGDRRDAVLIPGSGTSPGGGQGNPLQHSCLENSMDRGAWWARVHRVAQSPTGQRDLALLSSSPTFFLCWIPLKSQVQDYLSPCPQRIYRLIGETIKI